MVEAFRTFAVDPPYATATIAKKIRDRIEELSGQISAGYAQDWADYQKRLGYVQGLMEAYRLCQDMNATDEQERRAQRNAS